MSQQTLSPALEDRFEELETELERIDANVNGVFPQLSSLRDDVADLEARLDRFEERLEEATANAEMAVSLSARGPAEADGGPTKAGRARRLSRDEVIRATAEGRGAGAKNVHGDRGDAVGSVTVADVKDMAKPQMELKWKTVAEDAWPALVEEWPCFRIESPEDGSKRLTVDPDAIPTDLARVVERSLERDDLANRVVGDRRSGGG